MRAGEIMGRLVDFDICHPRTLLRKLYSMNVTNFLKVHLKINISATARASVKMHRELL